MCINIFIPEVRMMSEQAVRILRNILQSCRQTLDIHAVITLPSCSADLSGVGRNCIGPKKVGCLLLLYMRLYCVFYISDMPIYRTQYYGQNCRYGGVLEAVKSLYSDCNTQNNIAIEQQITQCLIFSANIQTPTLKTTSGRKDYISNGQIDRQIDLHLGLGPLSPDAPRPP